MAKQILSFFDNFAHRRYHQLYCAWFNNKIIILYLIILPEYLSYLVVSRDQYSSKATYRKWWKLVDHPFKHALAKVMRWSFSYFLLPDIFFYFAIP